MKKQKNSAYISGARLLMVLMLLSLMMAGVLYWYGGRHSLDEAVTEGRAMLVDLKSGQIVVGKVATQALAYAETSTELNKTQDSSTAATMPNVSPEANEKHLQGNILNSQQDNIALPTSEAVTSSISTDDKENYCTKPLVSIIVANIGLSKESVESAMSLPKVVALGFAPYANDVHMLVEQAVTSGFEVLLNVPMQPKNYPMNDPGPYALLNNLSIAENTQRLWWVLSRASRIVGVYSAEDETYSNTSSNIIPVLAELKKRNLIFAYGGQTNSDILNHANLAIGSDLALVNVILDEDPDAQAIRDNFKRLEGVARAHGSAIGLMHTYPITLDALKEWIAASENSEVILVPLSKLLKAKKEVLLPATANGALTEATINTNLKDATKKTEHVQP